LGLTLTGGIEFVIALVSGSVGLLGDAIHNLADVSTSLVAFVGFRLSRRGASASHPYGYERDEDPAGLGVALVIWASSVFDGYVSTHKLASHRCTSHLWLGVAAAAVGVLPAQQRSIHLTWITYFGIGDVSAGVPAAEWRYRPAPTPGIRCPRRWRRSSKPR
jgi:cation diffusion facilitator family transporter